MSDVAKRVAPSMFIPPKNETFEPPPAPKVATLVELFEKISNPAEVREVRSFVPRSGRVEVAVVELAIKYPAVRAGVPVATRFEPFHVTSALVERPAMFRPTVPVVVIVPPVIPLLVAIDVTVPPDEETRHVPLIEKQPLVRFRPLAKVEEAEAEEALKILAETPPVKVEVAVVVALMNPTAGEEEPVRGVNFVAPLMMIEYGDKPFGCPTPVPPCDTSSVLA